LSWVDAVRDQFKAATLVLLAVVGIAACGGGGSTPGPIGATRAPSIAPRFDAGALTTPAGADWITNGGSLDNDRFSTLDEVNAENVGHLKGDWMTKLGTSGAKFSAEGQALEYHGTIYISDGVDDVFALDAHDGRILWTYEPDLSGRLLDQTTCCGRENRGVALGDGMVFVSQLDGDQVALDQRTGEVVWATEVARPREKLVITSAPLYYGGRVYVGGSGEDGARGRLTAIDAMTGKILWRSFTVPGPGEPGHESWPADAWRHGGGAILSTPSVDPRLNMLYVSVGSPDPVWDGAGRGGDDKWTSSIVAMDADTGQIEWGYQQVHHDLWELGSASPTVLVDHEMDGKMVRAVAEPSRTGWLYILDRETGRPIYPIPEKHVGQDPHQATSSTQPWPEMRPFSPIVTSDESVIEAREAVAARTPKPEVTGNELFTPMSADPEVIALTPNSGIGGDDWPPASFDQLDGLVVVSSLEGSLGVLADPDASDHTEEPDGGGEIQVSSGVDTTGYLTAYDVDTGKIDWQNRFEEAPYSGVVTTAGGLVFVGMSNGELQAFDSTTGAKLWGFQTGAGINATATVFEDAGREKVGILGGGSSGRSDFWVFSLKGALGPVKAPRPSGPGAAHRE
jgi:quinohemoprotein ethanol dehydrogenase